MHNDDPLKPGYDFNAHLVAGLTPIIEDDELDFTIDRPSGMKGFIINMTCLGEGTIFSGEDSFDVKQGELLLFPPSTPHLYCRKKDRSTWFHRWVYFRPKAYWSAWLNWGEEKNGVFITRDLDREDLSQIESLFVEIDGISTSDTPYREDLAINLLEQLLIRCKTLQPDVISKPLDSRVIDIMHFISQNLNKDFSINDIAEHVCLSPSRLGHLFRSEMDMSITQWRDDHRISKAKHLLVTSNDSISQIARIVGYSDPLYFSRVFKKKLGISPKHYRAKSI